jgi:ketosteroid isomerase-like protein
MPNETAESERAVVQALYDRFGAHDGPGMEACYAPDATFSDPVFPSLRGREVGGMWRMLTLSSDLELTLDSLEPAGEHRWTAKWTARYTFSATKRRVTNRVTSNIRMQDDKIVEQHDEFDFAAWQSQALGLFATLLGWTGIPGRAIQKKAQSRLAAFLK